MSGERNRWAGRRDLEAPDLKIRVRSAVNDEQMRRYLAQCAGREWRRAPGRITPHLKALLDQLAEMCPAD